MNATIAVADLARAVHSEWSKARKREGWRLGPADGDARTSPFLKSLDEFSSLEWRRERWLALADIVAIAGCRPASLDSLRIERASLHSPHDEIDAIGRRAHAAWAAINSRLGFSDARAEIAFDDLDQASKARCRGNIACDIVAVGKLTAPLVDETISIRLCADMRTETTMADAVLSAMRSTKAALF